MSGIYLILLQSRATVVVAQIRIVPLVGRRVGSNDMYHNVKRLIMRDLCQKAIRTVLLHSPAHSPAFAERAHTVARRPANGVTSASQPGGGGLR